MSKDINVIDDLMNLKLKDIIDNYYVIRSLECDYLYGIASADVVGEMFDEYNIKEEYPEAVDVDTIIPFDLLLDGSDELIGKEKFVKIINNLGITKKVK